MLNKPKFMKPSTNKEECTVDAEANEILFSCIVDGNESIKHWQITIYKIENNEKVYDTGMVELTSSFYPVDERNRNVVFTKDIKKHPSVITNSFTNRAEAYYWTITLWGNSGCTTTSYQEVFYANKTPNISLNLSDGDVLTSRDYTFKAEYAQADEVQLKRYGWKITDTDSDQVLVDTITKNQIYGSADNIICKYEGFLNDGNYSVELFVETQNNAKITSSLKFSVSYSSTFLSNDFKVEALKNEPAIMLDWDKALVISGVLKDENNDVVNIEDTIFKTDYPVKSQSSIKIPSGFKVVYDPDSSLNLDIGEDSYIALSTQLLSGDKTTLFLAEGYDDDDYYLKRELSYSGGEFKYVVIGKASTLKSVTYKVANNPSDYVWYNILMSPMIKTDDGEYTIELKVFESKVVDCIYPSENLYPRDDFYPTFGNWDNLKEA